MPPFTFSHEVRNLVSVDRKAVKVKLNTLKSLFHIRTSISQDRVEMFRHMLCSGEELAPLLVTRNNRYLVDGRTRFTACEQEGKEEIDVIFCDEADRATLIKVALLCNSSVQTSQPPTEADITHTIHLMHKEGEKLTEIRRVISSSTGFNPNHVSSLVNQVLQRIEREKIKKALDAIGSEELSIKDAAEKFGVKKGKLQEEISGKKSKETSIDPISNSKAAITKSNRSSNTSLGMGFSHVAKKFIRGEITETEFKEFVMHEVAKARATVKTIQDHMRRFTEATGIGITVRDVSLKNTGKGNLKDSKSETTENYQTDAPSIKLTAKRRSRPRKKVIEPKPALPKPKKTRRKVKWLKN